MSFYSQMKRTFEDVGMPTNNVFNTEVSKQTKEIQSAKKKIKIRK